MKSFKPVAAALVVSAVAALGTGVAAPQESLDGEQSYVLTFDDGVDVDAVLVDLERDLDVIITHRFGTVVASAVVTTSEVPEAMVSLPGVATVDRNVAIQLEPTLAPVGAAAGAAEPPTPLGDGESEIVQPDDPERAAPWGLDRIDQRALPLTGTYDAPATGEGVIVYVIDSGVSPHEQFGGRLESGVDLVADGRGTSDCIGHGTHVAGTIAGDTVGLAPKASVVPVRSFTCAGTANTALTVAAFDWVAANHPAGRPGVVNYSAGGAGSDATNRAIESALARGLTVVTAAGNENGPACGVSSGNNLPGAIVVGATDALDGRAEYSNYGPCVEMFAPGDEVESSSIDSPSALTIRSGTSMAAPHVSGAAAVLLSLDPWRTGPEIEQALVADATPGVVGSPGDGSPNLLLYSDPARVAAPPSGAAAPAPPAPSPDVASVVEVRITIVEMPIRAAQTAVLAFTGGDPRAMTMGGLLLVLSGWMALVWSKRRQRFAATMPMIRVGGTTPDPFLQVRPRQGR